MTDRVKKAQDLFLQGCNCSQAVFTAYADIFGIDEAAALKLSAGLGAGCGRQRELCGAVSGAAMIIGLKFGSDNPADKGAKKLCYEKVREHSALFKQKNPSIVCRELLGLGGKKEGATPDERNSEYYKKRPCAQIVIDSAEALEQIIF